MFSVIKILDDDGKITDHAIYSLDPWDALICFLEQYLNKNYNVWEYKKSKFINPIYPLSSGKGFGYHIPDTNTCICAYEKMG